MRRALPALLPASVEAFGDVVTALLADLDRVTQDVGALGWLAGTGLSLDHELNHQAAIAQLAWWDGFLGALPSPRLLSEAREPEMRRAAALRARARLDALERAREEHRARVDEELGRGADEATRERPLRVREDPRPGEWRVDAEEAVRLALAALPAGPPTTPITAEDLDASTSFSGFNAVNAMRAHPELGPRAARMDALLAAALAQELGLERAEAARHASVLTGIFLIALRRALGQGSHQLAAAIRLLAEAEHAPVQHGFARELLESWADHLARIPPPTPRAGLLGGALGRLLGAREAPALPAEERRLLTAAPEPPASVWDRLGAAWRRKGG